MKRRACTMHVARGSTRRHVARGSTLRYFAGTYMRVVLPALTYCHGSTYQALRDLWRTSVMPAALERNLDVL